MTIHFEHEGTPISMLLDLVEVPKAHSGVNLAEAFVNILDEFGIEDKVSNLLVVHNPRLRRGCVTSRHITKSVTNVIFD